jgi:hypothetical protein
VSELNANDGIARPLTDGLLRPGRLFRRHEVLATDCPVPRVPGVYAWYFSAVPELVPTADCHRFSDGFLLYVGISPSRPPSNGKPPSKQRLFHRVRYHFRGNAEGSTLRFTLGCLLSAKLGIELRRAGNGKRFTFTQPGEEALSAWMEENARVVWLPCAEPWVVEAQLISSYSLPLNLDHNRQHPFHRTLTELRASSRERARSLPVVNRQPVVHQY